MEKDIEVILKDFVRHVVNLKAEDDPAGTGFHREFRILRELQIQNKNEDKFQCEDGKTEENMKKNRYKDIVPRDDKRVKLEEIPGQKGSDYINASFIQNAQGDVGYIAAQGPMPNTVDDFWRMLWEYNTEIIFMACRTKEENKPKCEQYWAPLGKSMTFGDITVFTESEEEIQDHFLKRQLRAEKEGQSPHQLTQFHYIGWPDHNTPSSPDALRCMIESVRNFRKRQDIPMVVHCSAGCGRTGTIIAIDLAWTMLDQNLIKEEFSMFEIIKSLREQRTSMVQTPDQYEYTHMVMKSLANEWLACFRTSDYENVTIGFPPEVEAPPIPEQRAYGNVDFGGEDTAASKETELVIRDNAKMMVQPTGSSKPLISNQKPDPKPRLKEEEAKQGRLEPVLLPEVVKIPRTSKNRNSSVDQGPASEGKGPAPKALTIAKPLDTDTGEYVEVKLSATTQSPPPLLPEKKNPPSNVHNLEPSLVPDSAASFVISPTPDDKHKTVIQLGSNNTMPKITKTGSVGLSATKVPSSKPTAAQALSHPHQQVSQPPPQQHPEIDEDFDPAYEVINVSKKATMSQVSRAVSSAEYENVLLFDHSPSPGLRPDSKTGNLIRLDSAEDGPVLPERGYKPEEIVEPEPKPTARKSKPQQPHYDNVTPNTTTTNHGPPTPNHGPPTPNMIDSRAPQPFPKVTQPVTVTSGPQVVAYRPAGQQGVLHRAADHQPVMIMSTSQQGRSIPGMVRAMGGAPPPAPQQPISRDKRSASLKSSKTVTAPLPPGNYNSYPGYPEPGVVGQPVRPGNQGPVVVSVHAPHHHGQQPARTIGRRDARLERARKPGGPRSQPGTWSARTRLTYL